MNPGAIEPTVTNLLTMVIAPTNSGNAQLKLISRVFGPDPWPNGVSANRNNLERFIQYSCPQGLIPQKLAVEELFAETTLDI